MALRCCRSQTSAATRRKPISPTVCRKKSAPRSTRNAQLKVAAPTSSNTFRGQDKDVRQIAAQLGVSFLLEGSVRKAGNVVRVAADLIDASTGFTSWSQTFDRKIDDIFAVQSEIATTVAGALAAKVTPGGRAPGRHGQRGRV